MPVCSSAPKTNRCNSCEILYINGIRCHEQGCPEAWRDYTRECRWCGGDFKPQESFQTYCDEDCARASHK